MNEKAREKLQLIANQPEKSFTKFVAKFLMKEDDLEEYISVVKKFWLATYGRYDVEDEELEDIYEEYKTEIESLVETHAEKMNEILSHSNHHIHSIVWWALELTVFHIEAIISEE